MPQDIQKTLRRLQQEFHWLLAHWAIYDQLFNASESTYKMLQSCSREAFGCIQNSLETEIIMSLSRLTDVPKQPKGDNERLSFWKLRSQITKSAEKDLSRKLREPFKTIEDGTRQIREHRDKRLAHLSSKVAIGEQLVLDRIPVRTIEDAIKALGDVMSTVLHHYQPDTEFKYDVPVSYEGGELVSLLRDGLRLRELIEEKKLSPEERKKGKWIDDRKEPANKGPSKDSIIFLR
jgi:hypothetical protein